MANTPSNLEEFKLKNKNGKEIGLGKIVSFTSKDGATSTEVDGVQFRSMANKDWYSCAYSVKDKKLYWVVLKKSKNADDEDVPKYAIEKRLSPFWLTKSREAELISLFLQASKEAKKTETKECQAAMERVADMGWGTGAKAVFGGLLITSAAIGGAILYEKFGPPKTKDVKGDDNNIYNNKTIDNHFAILLNQSKGNLSDVWTPTQIDAKWGNNTPANVTILEDLLAKDKIIDVMWGGYQTGLKAQGIASKEAMYAMTFGQLAETADKIGFEGGKAFVHSQALDRANEATKDIKNLTKPYIGVSIANITALDELVAKDNIIEEIIKLDSKIAKEPLYAKSIADLAKMGYDLGYAKSDAAAKQILIDAHKVVMDAAKLALSDAYTPTELNNSFGGVTLENITALESLVAVDPQIDALYADSDIATYFSHIGLTKKAAYTDSGLQSKAQAGIEYKCFAGVVKTLDENDFYDTERAVTLNYLNEGHAKYPWLVVGLDETNTSQKAALRNMLTEQGGNLSENFKQAIQHADIFYLWAPTDAANPAPLMYSKDTDGLFPITAKDLDIAKQYLL